MRIENPVEKFGSYVISQGKDSPGNSNSARRHSLAPAITISYQAGVDVSEISGRLAEILQNSEPEHGQTWSVLNQQLIEAALEAQRWPKELAEAMPEEKRLFIDELMDDLCGLRPPSWVLVPQVVKTTLHLALKGRVILIGHGATVVTARMWNVFHVRFNGSLPKRYERVQTRRNLSPEAAAKLVMKEDRLSADVTYELTSMPALTMNYYMTWRSIPTAFRMTTQQLLFTKERDGFFQNTNAISTQVPDAVKTIPVDI